MSNIFRHGSTLDFFEYHHIYRSDRSIFICEMKNESNRSNNMSAESSARSDAITLPNNNWTKPKEDKLIEWQRQSRLHSLGHGRAQEMYTKKNNRIQLPTIVTGAVAVFMDGVALVLKDLHVPFVITALLLTAIVTICNGILQTTKPVEKAAEHEAMAQGYNKIILQIDSMLAKEYCERQNGSSFLTKIEEELIALKTGGIKIPAVVWTTLKNDFAAGECDFQKLADESGFGGRRTIVVSKRSSSKEIVVPAPTPDTSASDGKEPTRTTVLGNRQDESVVDIPESDDDELPRFEFNIDNPNAKKLEKLLVDFQLSRFG